ncbi:hypothetical protein SUGI_1034510 [Cryptomeria japonica]|nr:hypothetical protein SUGI_1034510 [Cryptomeria japonica]
MTDEVSLNLMNTTFMRLLVEMDSSKDLPSEIFISTSKGSRLQPVDYEGISFRCGRCFDNSHSVDSCDRHRVKRATSWWKGVTPNLYTMEKEEVNMISSHFPQALSGENLGDKGKVLESKGDSSGKSKVPETKGDSGTSLQGKIYGIGGVGNVNVNVVRCVDLVGSEHMLEPKAKSVSKMVTGATQIDLQSLEEKRIEVLGASNLKLLENARDEGWVEVKRKRDRRAKDDNIRLTLHSQDLEEVNQLCT